MRTRSPIAATLLAALLAGCQGADLPEAGQKQTESLVVKYHPNGARAEECGYLAGKRHGPCLTWNAEGQLTSEGRFREGLREGTHYARIRYGEVYRDYRDGMLNGRCTLVNNMQVTVDTPFHLGVPHGRLEARGPDGCRLGEMYFDHGQLHGRSVMWNNDGTLMETGYFEDGQAQGFWRFWDRNGRLEAEGSFINGQRHGYWVLYRCCGQPPLESYCHHGEPSKDCASSWRPAAKLAPGSVLQWCRDSVRTGGT